MPKSIKWIAQRCTVSHYVRCISGDQGIVHEILHEAQGNGESSYHVKRRDTVVLRNNLAIFAKEGDAMESHRPLHDDEYVSLTNREHWVHWVAASWKPTYEAGESIFNSEQTQQFLARKRARLKPSQQKWGPTRRDADLTDDRQIQGNWVESSHR